MKSEGKREIFIQANGKQLFGAKIAKFAMETRGHARERDIPVNLIEVEKIPAFQQFVGKPYRKGYLPYTFDDLQSFTLTRFMPPEHMGYRGKAVVIDPDIFALADIGELFETDMKGAAIAACRKYGAWDTSVMLLDCAKLTHWNIAEILASIATEKRVYTEVIGLYNERAEIMELPLIWNSLDKLTPDTKMLHATNRITQPWKTGLPIDFTLNPLSKFFGIVPRKWVHTLLRKYPTHYQPHPDKDIENLFFKLTQDALGAGVIDRSFVEKEVESKHVRSDILQRLRV